MRCRKARNRGSRADTPIWTRSGSPARERSGSSGLYYRRRCARDSNPDLFVGQTLATVTFGPYLVTLSFEPDANLIVTLEGTYEQSGPPDQGWIDRAERIGDQSRLQASRLMQLTNCEVVAAAVENQRSFRLNFADGQSLRLIDDSDHYESMQIHHGDRYWVI
jgi:hypothetical protein